MTFAFKTVIRTPKQTEAHRHNWTLFLLKGARATMKNCMPSGENIQRKIDNFFSELLQIEYARYKHNKEKLSK